jgi:hypothetical protein
MPMGLKIFVPLKWPKHRKVSETVWNHSVPMILSHTNFWDFEITWARMRHSRSVTWHRNYKPEHFCNSVSKLPMGLKIFVPLKWAKHRKVKETEHNHSVPMLLSHTNFWDFEINSARMSHSRSVTRHRNYKPEHFCNSVSKMPIG